MTHTNLKTHCPRCGKENTIAINANQGAYAESVRCNLMDGGCDKAYPIYWKLPAITIKYYDSETRVEKRQKNKPSLITSQHTRLENNKKWRFTCLL